jgi:hypothetical protein
MKAPRVGAFLFPWLKVVQTDFKNNPIPFVLDIKNKKDTLSFIVGVVE